MPSAPLRPCAAQGCGTLVKAGRCAAHRKEDHREEDARRGSRQDRGYGRAWDKIRAYILRRDHLLCQVCRRATATEVDHIIEKADGGEDTPENLQAICSPCHGAKTGHATAARRSGASGADCHPQGAVKSLESRHAGPRAYTFTRIHSSDLGFRPPGAGEGV